MSPRSLQVVPVPGRTVPRTSSSPPTDPTRAPSSPAPGAAASTGSATTLGRSSGSRTPVAARSASSRPRRPAARLRRLPWRAPRRPGTGTVEPVVEACDGRHDLLQQRSDRRGRRRVVLRLLDEVRLERWKDDFVQDTRTGRLCGSATTARRGRPRRARLRQRRGAQRRTSSSPSPRRRAHRRTPLARRGAGRHARPPGRRTCPATRTTSPAARRPDLGDHRQPERRGRRADPAGADVAPPAGRPDPGTPQPKPKRTVRVQAYDDAAAGPRRRRGDRGLPHGHRRP